MSNANQIKNISKSVDRFIFKTILFNQEHHLMITDINTNVQYFSDIDSETFIFGNENELIFRDRMGDVEYNDPEILHLVDLDIKGIKPVFCSSGIFRKKKVSYIKLLTTHSNISLRKAKRYLVEINRLLHLKYPMLNIVLEFRHNLRGSVFVFEEEVNHPVLCLYFKGYCISTVVLDIEEEFIIIRSKTVPEFESRGYNKLLRAVSIMISPLITNNGNCMTSVESGATNPKSAWLMMAYYNAQPLDEELFYCLENGGEITKEMLREHINRETFLNFIVDLSEENVSKAENVFYRLINNEHRESNIVSP